MNSQPAEVSWSPRAVPLDPVAVAATGGDVAALAASALARLEAGATLRAAAGDGWLLVAGPEAELPWCDGARYLAEEGGLLVSTTERCAPPADVVLAAIRARSSRPGLAVALLPGTALLGPPPERVADRAALARLAGADGRS